MLAGYHSQHTAQIADPNTLPVFLSQGSICLSKSCGRRGRLPVGILAGAYGSALREQRPVDTNSALSLSASFQPAGIFQN